MSLLLAWSLTAAQSTPSIDGVLSRGFQDASFTARILRGDQPELAKINKDFGQSYRFQYTTVKMKEPFMLRLETNVDDTDITFVINGAHKMFRIPKARLVQREDLSKAPGRRQTALDFGLLPPSLFKDLYDATFVRIDRASGAYVFDVTYKKNLEDTSRSRLWIDPERHYIVKREWYNQVGRQLATFFYDKPRQISGVWLPTRLTVKNVDNKVAGVTQYDGIKVNTGLDDALFTP